MRESAQVSEDPIGGTLDRLVADPAARCPGTARRKPHDRSRTRTGRRGRALPVQGRKPHAVQGAAVPGQPDHRRRPRRLRDAHPQRTGLAGLRPHDQRHQPLHRRAATHLGPRRGVRRHRRPAERRPRPARTRGQRGRGRPRRQRHGHRPQGRGGLPGPGQRRQRRPPLRHGLPGPGLPAPRRQGHHRRRPLAGDDGEDRHRPGAPLRALPDLAEGLPVQLRRHRQAVRGDARARQRHRQRLGVLRHLPPPVVARPGRGPELQRRDPGRHPRGDLREPRGPHPAGRAAARPDRERRLGDAVLDHRLHPHRRTASAGATVAWQSGQVRYDWAPPVRCGRFPRRQRRRLLPGHDRPHQQRQPRRGRPRWSATS